MGKDLLLSVLTGLLVATSSCYGQPASDRTERECVEFTHSYCNKFNYTTAIFPNPRGHETPEEAAAEFNDFVPLLNRRCSPKLGTLLCFMYFPVCNKPYFNPKSDLVDGFYPCRELCQEVHLSACTLHILSAVGTWAPHLQCNFTDEDSSKADKRFYKPANSLPVPTNCVNGAAPLYIDNHADNECTSGTHNCHANAECTDTAAGFNCTCKNGFAGNGRNCSDVNECLAGTHSCSENAECTNTEGGYTCTCNAGYTGDGKNCTAISTCTEGECLACKYRKNAGIKTFKLNCFCYAAHVSVASSSKEDCNHVYTMTVKEQFDVKTPYNTTFATSAPVLSTDQQITVVANPSHCDTCFMLTVGQEYIIAGSYSRSEDGATIWNLEGHDNRALASPWVDRYAKKMSKWVQDANVERQHGLSCLKACEK